MQAVVFFFSFIFVTQALHSDSFSHIKANSYMYRERIRELKAQGVRVDSILPKKENVTMRDGVKLYTVVWTADWFQSPKKPTVFARSPYGPDGSENFALLFLIWGFNVVMQNERGTGKSEGAFTFWHSAANDATDTYAAWSNGEIYEMGASADGILTYLALLNPQPALKSQWTIWSSGFPYKIAYPDGAYRYQLVHHWLDDHMHPWRPKAPDYQYTVLQNEPFNAFWQEVTLSNFTRSLPSVHNAAWYDIFLQPMIDTWKGYVSSGVKDVKLIVGQRGHCEAAAPWVDLNSREDLVFGYEQALHNFDVYSVSRTAVRKNRPLDKVTLYVMGPVKWPANRRRRSLVGKIVGQYWTTLPSFPPFKSQRYFLGAGGKLVPNKPKPLDVSYIYNPQNPCPTIGGNNLFEGCGPVDQRPLENRTDIVLFTSDAMKNHTAICGNVIVTLAVSSNCTDTDFVVRLTDVWPSGESMLLTDRDLRMRWRVSDRKPTLMVPGKVYYVNIELWATCYVFNIGHKIRISVTSSTYPRYSATPNNGKEVIAGGPQLVARNVIHIGDSYVSLPVVDRKNLPENVDFL